MNFDTHISLWDLRRRIEMGITVHQMTIVLATIIAVPLIFYFIDAAIYTFYNSRRR